MGYQSQLKEVSESTRMTKSELEEIGKQLESWLVDVQKISEGQLLNCAPSLPSAEEGDRASDEYERTFDLHLKERAQVSLREIQEALKKVGDGTYGTCEECAGSIDIRRLRAQPATRLCIECQSELEASVTRRYAGY